MFQLKKDKNKKAWYYNPEIIFIIVPLYEGMAALWCPEIDCLEYRYKCEVPQIWNTFCRSTNIQSSIHLSDFVKDHFF